jgi:hypothetical protein
MEELDVLLHDCETANILAACQILATNAGGPAGINLEGYLLTPIQRVCKYPLLLRELLKVQHNVLACGHPLDQVPKKKK